MQTITKDKFLKLKSGTDVRGVAVETSTEKIELTDEVVEACLLYTSDAADE